MADGHRGLSKKCQSISNSDESVVIELNNAFLSELCCSLLCRAERLNKEMPLVFSCLGKNKQIQRRDLLEMISLKMTAITQIQKNGGTKIDLSILRDFRRSPTMIELCASLPFSFTLIEDSMQLKVAGLEEVQLCLTCPICLEILFQPLGLRCGHVFCKICAERAQLADCRCPVCRETNVYNDALRMKKLGIILKKRYRAYWRECEKQLAKEAELQYMYVP